MMDHYLTLLHEFPPTLEFDDADYHRAAKAHVAKLEKLIKDTGFISHAEQLLQVVDPTHYSMSHLALLTALFSDTKTPRSDILLSQTATFIYRFQPRQIRYAGAAFSSLLGILGGGETFPASVAVDLLATALQKLDPTGSVLTSHHVALVQLAHVTDNIEAALPVLDKTIVFFPSTRIPSENFLPCDMSLHPSVYVTPELSLTSRLQAYSVLLYDSVRALCYMARRSWQQAFDALERVITYPCRDGGCSRIMVEAHNKWVLVSLLLTGKAPTSPPTTSQSAQKAFTTVGKQYLALAKAFEHETAAVLQGEYQSVGSAYWAEENNTGLVEEVLRHYQRWQILRLREVYSKLSLAQVRELTQSGETGAPLTTDAEVEELVRAMIADGMLRGGAIEQQQQEPSGDADEAGGGGAYLVFSDPPAPREAEVAAEIAGMAQRVRDLEPFIKITNERLATNREYIRHLIKEQKRDKDAASRDMSSHLDQIEDEDLMTGVVST